MDHQHAAALASSSRRSLSWGSSISQSFRQMETEDPFGRAQSEQGHRDEEENLRWAALEKLPTYDRMRRGIIRKALDDDDGGGDDVEVVDIHKLAGGDEGRALLERLFQDDSERFLRRLRDRIDMYAWFFFLLQKGYIDISYIYIGKISILLYAYKYIDIYVCMYQHLSVCRVGIELPMIEVRYEQLTVEADVVAAGRSLPTLLNTTANFLEVRGASVVCMCFRIRSRR
jgi:hypothetical protein